MYRRHIQRCLHGSRRCASVCISIADPPIPLSGPSNPSIAHCVARAALCVACSQPLGSARVGGRCRRCVGRVGHAGAPARHPRRRACAPCLLLSVLGVLSHTAMSALRRSLARYFGGCTSAACSCSTARMLQMGGTVALWRTVLDLPTIPSDAGPPAPPAAHEHPMHCGPGG